MDDEDVEGIVVLGLRGWDKPPIVRIGQACHQGLRQVKNPKFRIVFEFAMTPARSLHDGVDVRFVRPGGKLCQIGHLMTKLLPELPRRAENVPCPARYEPLKITDTPPGSEEQPAAGEGSYPS
jgi:hypothetical protein